MDQKYMEGLGTPDIKLAGLQIWVHGRQFPDAADYWDGNWLSITVHCGAEGSSVWASGSIIHLPELSRWLDSAEKISKTLQGEANLDCMEPELSVFLKARSLGHIDMEVNITPSNLSQAHKYYFEVDQSYLDNLMRNCRAVLDKYPIRGSQE